MWIIVRIYIFTIKRLREYFDDICIATTEFMEKVNTEFFPLSEIRSRKRKKMLGELTSDDPILDLREAFKIKTSYTTVDTIEV